MSDHPPTPGPAVAGGRIALCLVCTEKLVRLDDGTWEHFGEDVPFEPMELGGSPVAEPEPTRWGLVMPFVVCQSQGGPYDDDAFAAGWQAGEIAALLRQHPETLEVTVRTELLPQLDLIAMQAGFSLTSRPWEEHPDEWSFAAFTPSEPSP